MVDLYCLEELVDFMGRLTIDKEGLMNFGRRIALYVLLYVTLCSAAFAQVVEIPDPNLRAEIRQELNLGANDVITRKVLRNLIKLVANGRGIESINGLEFATNFNICS